MCIRELPRSLGELSSRGLKYAMQNSRRKVELTNLMNDMSMAPSAEGWWKLCTGDYICTFLVLGVIKGLWNCSDHQRGMKSCKSWDKELTN